MSKLLLYLNFLYRYVHFSVKLIYKYSLQGIGEYTMLSRKTHSQIIEIIETVREGLVCQNTKERAAMLDECIAALSAY